MNVLMEQMFEAYMGESTRIVRLIDMFESYEMAATFGQNHFIDVERDRIVNAILEVGEFGKSVALLGVFRGREDAAVASSKIMADWVHMQTDRLNAANV